MSSTGHHPLMCAPRAGASDCFTCTPATRIDPERQKALKYTRPTHDDLSTNCSFDELQFRADEADTSGGEAQATTPEIIHGTCRAGTGQKEVQSTK
mmetsp:Transcript_40277/g.65421  ORF Transcript_40277/g.65421 Transcript_40277/m.65421 type:complete len:96 (-) Transcript_40277:92-379(-)